MKTTFLVQTTEGHGVLPSPGLWTPWKNCESASETASLAAHRHVRQRGGIAPDEALRVYVYVAPPDENLYPNGSPRDAIWTVFNITPEKQN